MCCFLPLPLSLGSSEEWTLGSTPPAAIVTLHNMRRRNCHDTGSTTPNEMMLITLLMLP